MRHETKLNLVFLALFLSASLPGAVILFRKKLAPGARPIFLSDMIDRRVPYMSPTDPPPGYRRVIPPLTAQWLNKLVQDRAASSVLMATDARGNPQPILSQDHQFQLVRFDRAQGRVHLSVIAWNPSPPQASDIHASVRTESGPVAVHRGSTAKIDLPTAVKTELINLGLLKVPASILWIDLESDDPGERLKELVLEFSGGHSPSRQTLVLFSVSIDKVHGFTQSE